MRFLRRFLRRFASWATTRQDEDRLRLEIEEHLALQTADNIRAGLPPAEARRQAVLRFGNVEAMKETYRERRGLPSVERLIQDTRYALRRLRLAPAFTISTVLTLALGIGATASIFTLVYAVILGSLPVSKPEQLYRLGQKSRSAGTPRRMSFRWSRMRCTSDFGTIRTCSRNLPPSAPDSMRSPSGGRAGPRPLSLIRANSSPATTSLCSA